MQAEGQVVTYYSGAGIGKVLAVRGLGGAAAALVLVFSYSFLVAVLSFMADE
jgi:hypothetical protein